MTKINIERVKKKEVNWIGIQFKSLMQLYDDENVNYDYNHKLYPDI